MSNLVARQSTLRCCIILLLLAFPSCATYYQTNYDFNQSFEQGKLEKALQALDNSSSRDYRKKEFLYLSNN
ncbi:MAG TPA: hypothetical protein DIS90_00125, partial [Cytophagales bacterium]|nr:hypothetical protein [Cytophagales bacterium]